MLDWSDSLDDVDWPALSDLYRRAPLGDKPPELLRTVFGNSRYHWLVRDNGVLVAAGRAVADGADCACICDVVVCPTRQGTGLGQAMVQRLVEQCRGHRKIILYSVPGKEPFYARFGFRRMLTAMAIFQNPAAAVQGGYVGED